MSGSFAPPPYADPAIDHDRDEGAEERASMRCALLRDDRRHVLMQGALGVTVYLANGVQWARDGALAALELWLSAAAAAPPRWYATSISDRWHAVESTSIASLRQALPLHWARANARHLFRVRLADRTDAPSASFSYRELDEDRAPCAGYLQCVLPSDTAPAHFERFVRALLSVGTYWWATAGGFASTSPSEPEASSLALRARCRRYVALDVQAPDSTALGAAVREGITSVSWITALGKPMLASRPEAAEISARSSFAHGVRVSKSPFGALVYAGNSPRFGDLNTLSYPHAYAEAAHLLAAFTAETPPAFRSWEPETARAWQRRFLEPEGWK